MVRPDRCDNKHPTHVYERPSMRHRLQLSLPTLVLALSLSTVVAADTATAEKPQGVPVALTIDASGVGGNGINNAARREFRLALNRNQIELEVYINGTLLPTSPLSRLNSVVIKGSSADDVLIVDSSNGLISLSGGIRFDGGGGANRIVLTQTGTRNPAQMHETFTASSVGDEGSECICEPTRTQAICFRNVQSVLNTIEMASLTVNGTAGDNRIAYARGSSASNGKVTVDRLTPIEFSRKTTLVIHGGGGNDAIVLNNPSTPAGLAGIAVQGDAKSIETALEVHAQPGITERATIVSRGPGAGLITFRSTEAKQAAVSQPASAPESEPSAGVVVWLDASTPKLADGAAVTLLYDLTGHGHHAKAFNPKNPPTYKAKSQAGEGTVHFNEGDQGLVTIDNLGIKGDASRTMFVVMAKSAPMFSYDWRGSMRVDMGDASSKSGFGVNSGQSEMELPCQGMGDIQLYPRSNVTYEVYCVTHDAATHNSYGYVNGTLMGASVNQPIHTADGPLQIGYRASDRASSVGDVAEVLVYDSALDDTARKQVDEYLKAKWAIGEPRCGGDGRTPYVVFSSIKQLTLVGQADDHDTLSVQGTRGDDRIQYATESGKTLVTGTMDQNNVTGKGPYPLVPLSITGMSASGPSEPRKFSFGNVVPLGSSLTYGDGVPGGYRTRLYSDATGAGYSLNFVGSVAENASELLAAAGQLHQEGHGGFETYRLDVNVDGWLRVTPDPDYFLVLCGTNDFGHKFKVKEAIDRLDTLVSHLASVRPYAQIIVCSECKRTDDATANWQIENLYNPFIPGMVARHAALGQKVAFLDMHAVVQPEDLGPDKLHPNKTGYDKMGHAWFQALEEFVTTGGKDEVKDGR